MIALASDYYGKPIFRNLLGMNTDLKISKEGGNYVIKVPEFFSVKSRKLIVRPKAVALLGLLESGAMDYAIEYKSVAIQHGLRYVELPKEINLSDVGYQPVYSKVAVVLGNGKVVKGKPIAYGITIVKNAPHPGLAKMWEDFVTSRKGAEILRECYQNPVYPPKVIRDDGDER